jgi:hypothetical protein
MYNFFIICDANLHFFLFATDADNYDLKKENSNKDDNEYENKFS